MVDDILRMRATISTEESLAALRTWGREIGAMPQRIKPAVNDLNKTFGTLGKTIQGVGKEITSIVPSLGAFGLGAAGASVAAGVILRTFSDVADKLVELKFASKELGMSEREIRAWSVAAQKVGVSSQSMMQGLKGFHDAMGALQYNQGSAMELYAKGAGPLASKLKGLKDEGKQLVEVFKFKDTLLTLPNGQYRAQQLFTDLHLNAELLRVSADEVAATFAKLTPRTNEQEEAAQKYIEGLVNLGETWDELKNKVATPLFPWLTSEMEKMERYQQQWDDFLKWVDSKKTAAGTLGAPVQMPPPPLPPAFKPPFVPTPPGSTVPGLPGAVFKFADMGGGGKYDDFLSALPFPNAEGQIEDRRGEGGDGSGAQRIVKAGVFEALVDFQSYAQAGAGGGRAQFFGGGATGGMGASGGVGGGGAIGGGGLGAGSGGGGGINIPGGIGGAAGPTGGAGSAGDRDGRPSGPGSVGAGTGGAAPRGSGGGSGGITAPAGTAITKTGLATVTTPSGKQFKVDARYAQNFKGFLSDYEKAGGVLGPDTGSLGFRPRNASGHPIGAAIDVNQIGYGVRSKRGTSLAPDVEDALAAKWGMVSGHQWRRPDTGHFGIRNFEAARQALIKNGVEPGKASEIAAQSSGGPGNGTTVKGSVFGSGFGFGTDRTEPYGRKTASGVPNYVPGIALPSRSGLGKMHEVTTPDGRTFMLPQTDIGPAARTGRGIDISASAAEQMGYSKKDFPTDQPFSYRRIDERIAGAQKVDGQVHVQIHSDGTAARAKTKTNGDLFQKTSIQSYKQMQPTSAPAGRVNADASTLPAQVGN